jgi:hypothetical protein
LTLKNFFLKAAIMPAAIGKTNPAPEDLQDAAQHPIDPLAEVPAWLAARRERPAELAKPSDENSPAGPALSLTPPVRPTSKRKVPKPIITITPEPTDVPSRMEEGWVRRWISDQGMIGIGVSLLVHALALLILACIFVSQVRKVDEVSLWGTAGNSDEVSDTVIETDLPGDIDAGESAPLQMTSVSEALDSIGPHGTVAESMRVGGLGGGNGHGQGESGDGSGMGVAGPKVPGHAQTKGSFSAWPDPRDPKPGEDYFIVIQIRLPKNITKYRGSDVSGNVIGTDGYRQAIRFKPNETLDVEDGAVRMRIFVPGAARLIRDTIRVESKLLKEKQTFEIEF